MSTQLLAPGTAAADSSAQTLAAGTSAFIFLTRGTGGTGGFGSIQVRVRTSDGVTYQTVAVLDANNLAYTLVGPATFIVSRASVTTLQVGADVEVGQVASSSSVASNVTTVSASTPIAGQPRMKTFQASGTTTSGTGSATVQIQGSNGSTGPWDVIGTMNLTLSTTVSSDSFTSNDRYAYLRSNVTAISGTGASVNVTMGV